MSAKLTGQVWELDLPHAQLLVLLALADHAKDDGSDVFPSVARTAWKAGYSARQTQRIMRQLEKLKILVLVQRGGDDGRPNRYRIDVSKAARKPEFGGRQNDVPRTATDSVGTQNVTPGVTSSCHGGGDITVSPEPSVNHQDNRQSSVSSLRSETGASAGQVINSKPKRIGDALTGMVGSAVPIPPAASLRQCLGFAEFDGACTNPADSRRTPYWCQRCDDLRCASISKQLHDLHNRPNQPPPRKRSAESLNAKRSRLMGVLSKPGGAWLGPEPPEWTTRDREADVLGQLLEQQGEGDVEVAIEGARKILGDTPFSVRVLVDQQTFQWARDLGYQRLQANVWPQLRAALMEALTRAA